MTTLSHDRDWKVTTGYRVLLRMAWGLVALAVYGGVVAILVGVADAWWLAVGAAGLALVMGAMLPEPVPAEMLTRHRQHIDSRRDS
mgnify:CR=1 FL=1